MSNESGADRFARLSDDQRRRYREAGLAMVRLAQEYAVPIIFAPPVSVGGKINGATGCVLELASGWFIVSASRVLEGYEERINAGEELNWQVGNLPPFDPLRRVASRDPVKDTLLLRLTSEEARKVGGRIITAYAGWPPPLPTIGQVVLVAGYPKTVRELDSEKRIGAGSFAVMFKVTTTGEGYFICQIERDDLESFNEKSPLPDSGTDLGGLSGSPAFLVGTVAYPLVGVVSQYNQDYELLEGVDAASIEIMNTNKNARSTQRGMHSR